MNKDGGGSAYPWTYDNGEIIKGDRGMSLRDYFAAAALQGTISGSLRGGYEPVIEHIRGMAQVAYIYADAMLEARERK